MPGVPLTPIFTFTNRMNSFRRHLVACKLLMLASCALQTPRHLIPVLDLLYDLDLSLRIVHSLIAVETGDLVVPIDRHFVAKRMLGLSILQLDLKRVV